LMRRVFVAFNALLKRRGRSSLGGIAAEVKMPGSGNQGSEIRGQVLKNKFRRAKFGLWQDH